MNKKELRQSRMSSKHTAEMPGVGLWWFHKGECYKVSVPWREADNYQEIYNIPDDHIDAWSQVRREISKVDPSVAYSEYEEIERGRVLYNKGAGYFIIMCSTPMSKDKKSLARIKAKFGIPSSAKIKIQTDEHYENPENIDFEEDELYA